MRGRVNNNDYLRVDGRVDRVSKRFPRERESLDDN